jgi:uncharacterized protein (TIGR03437 family)
MRSCADISLRVLVLYSIAFCAFAQLVQQGNKLSGSDAVGTGGQQGASLALSSDGNTALVGGPGDNHGAGAAWVFTRTNGMWSQQGAKLVGTGATGTALQGASVGLSADGNTAIIGGPRDSSFAGAAWLFTRTNGTWSQQGPKLVGTGAAGASSEGFSVAVSGDGNTAIVGGPNDNGGAGAAWVFTRSNGVWTQQGNKLAGTGGVGGATQQASSVGLSADGNTAIVGGNGDASQIGAAWLFTRSNGAWTQQGNKLVGTGAVSNALEGTSVGISADGNTALVGGNGDNNDAGAAWVFTRSGGVWTQQGNKLVGTGAVGNAQQGAAVSLSADGNAALIGGFNDSSVAGAAWLFTRSGGVWTQSGSKLSGTGAAGSNVAQGSSVGLSADGGTAMLGAFGDNGNTGAVWPFVKSNLLPAFTSTGVVNGASFQPGIAPNSWFTIQGTNLSPTTDTWDKAIVNGALPTSLDGVTVTASGKPAYIYFISPAQINAVAPDVGAGAVSVTVTTPAGASPAVSVTSQIVGPAFFLWAGKYAVATRQDFSLAAKNGTLTGVTTSPAKPGDVIILWGTGFGPTIPPAPFGIQIPASQSYATANPVTVSIGNIPAQVYGAALAPGFAALYQVAIQIPLSAPDGDLPVSAIVNGTAAPNAVITIQH